MKFAGAANSFAQIFFQVLGSIVGYFIVIGIATAIGKNFLYIPLVLTPFFMLWGISTFNYKESEIDTFIIDKIINAGFLYLYYQKFVELSSKNSGQSGAGRRR
jgi:hypothetical protein